MALVNDTLASGNDFGERKGHPYGSENVNTYVTEVFSVKATAQPRWCRYFTTAAYVHDWGVKAVEGDIVVDASESTAPVFEIILENTAGTQTSKGTITLVATTTVEHEDPPANDSTFTAFHVARGETVYLDHKTAGTHASTSGNCNLQIDIQEDPSDQLKLG